MKSECHLIALLTALWLANGEAAIDYGTDVSFPMHYPLVTDLAHERHLLGSDKQELYQEHLEGCFQYYNDNNDDSDERRGKELCMEVENARIAMNKRQPQSMVNYTRDGFVKIRAPEKVWNLVQTFWQQNKHNIMEEEWPGGSIFVNHWKSPVHFVAVDNATLPGGGNILKNAIWNAARDTLQEWTGYQMADCSLYGVRIYHADAILVPHVDRLPLVASAILNVDQDVDEPWPLEVIGHDQRAHNITMEPGDLILYESHSIIHGRPFPLKGRFMANIFIHFEPVALMSEPNPVFQGDLPPYVVPNSPEHDNWLQQNPHGWNAVRTEALTSGTTEAHQMAVMGDFKLLRDLLDLHPQYTNAADDNGWTPLHEAARTLRYDLIQLLVERGADVNAVTRSGHSVLGLAYEIAMENAQYQVHSGSHPVVQYLEEAGAKRILHGEEL